MKLLRKFIRGKLPGRRAQDNAARGNKFAAAAMKKKWTQYVALNFANTPPLTGHFRMVCTWREKTKREDPDNIASSKKFILDGLQDSGVLRNDGWAEIAGFIDNFEIDKVNPGVEVLLIEVPKKRR
jgi:hypothetical protein